MTSTETRSTLNGQGSQATEKTAEVFKQNVHQATERAEDLVAQLPKVNLSEGVERYFEFVQKAVDLQRDMATQWADLLTSMSGSLREQAESFRHVVTEQTDKVTDLTVQQTEKAEQAAQEQADKLQDAEKARAREAKRVEREEGKKAQHKTREAYEDLTKAELADQLAQRGLPRTGNIEELIERLVTADSN
jgi:hypothetical protein